MAPAIALLAIALAAIPLLVVAQTVGIDIYQRHFSTLMGGGGCGGQQARVQRSQFPMLLQ